MTAVSFRERSGLDAAGSQPGLPVAGRNTNAITSGMIESSEPVMMVEKRAWEPEPALAVDCHWASPTVNGNLSAELSMISGRK